MMSRRLIKVDRSKNLLTSMRVAVFGATGSTGTEIVGQCAARGHQVVAAARRPEAVSAPDGVQVKQISLDDDSSLRSAVAGCDVIVSALGDRGGLSGARRGTNLYSSAARALRKAMREEGVKRLIMLSSAGVQEDEGSSWIFNMLLRRYVMNLYLDMSRMEAILEESVPEIEFTVVRLPFLFGTKSSEFIVGDRALGNGAFRISYVDAARFVVQEIEERKWINGFPVPSYP